MKWKIPIILAAGVVSLATSAIFIKLSSAPAAVIAFYRLGIAVLLMTPFMWARELPSPRKMTSVDLFYTTASGVFLALHFVLWFESLRYTSVTSSVFFVTLSPIFSFYGVYIFFGDRLSWRQLGAGLLALFGGLVIAFGDMRLSGMALWGDMLALAGAAAASGYWLIGQRLRKRVPFFAYTYVLYGIGAIALLVYALLMRHSLFAYGQHEWLLFFLLAIVPTLLGHSLFNWLLRWVSATVVSVSILAEAVVASVLAYFIFGEQATWFQWIGSALIVAGVYCFLRMWSKGDQL